MRRTSEAFRKAANVSEKIRNIGFFGHGGAGKTTLAEAILYLAKASSRLGRVDDGTSILDYDDEEVNRHCSLNLAIGFCDWNGHRLNLIDVPGYTDFIGEALSGLYATDTAIIVVDASSGVEVGTERMWREAETLNLPRAILINKLKKENTDFYKILKEAVEAFGKRLCLIHLPIGQAEKFSGVVDLLEEQAFIFENGKAKSTEIPADLKDRVAEYREHLIEALADADDDLMNKYLEGSAISNDELKKSLKKGLALAQVFPVLLGDAYNLIGIENLLTFTTGYLPSPLDRPEIMVADKKIKRNATGPLLGYVFKTVSEPHLGELLYIRVLSGKVEAGTVVMNTTQGREEKINQIYLIRGKEREETKVLETGMIGALVKLKLTKTGDTLSAPNHQIILSKVAFPKPSIDMAIVPKTKGDEEKVSNGLSKLHEEDPTFTFHYDPELKQLLISGIGELHLEVILSRLKRKFGVEVELHKPKIPFRETFTKKAESQGKYKKQTGGRGQYGDVWLKVEPLPRGTGFEFKDEIFGGAVPSKYVPPVEKGVNETMAEGVLAGYQIMDLRVTIYDGSFHPVDSSDIAFKIAGSMAFKNCAEKGGMILLEPIMEVEVVVPESYMGDVMGDLNARRGRISGMDSEGRLQKIKALVPQAEMYKYSTSLRSMTQGRGFFSMQFRHYEEVPKEIAAKIIEESKKAKSG